MKLSEYQNQVYKNDREILELYEKNAELKKEAGKSLKEKDEANVKKLANKISDNTSKVAGFESKNIELANKLEERRAGLDKLIKDLTESQIPLTRIQTNALSEAKTEIESYSRLVVNHDNAIKKAALEKKQQQEKIYKEEKTKLFNAAGNFISDPASLNEILEPLAEKKGKKESVGVGDMISAGWSAFTFGVKNAGSVIDIVGSVDFYKAEAAKIPRGKGEKEDTSFFLKLLVDPESVKFLEKNSAKLGNLVEAIAPNIISIGVRELSKLPELKEQLKNDLKEQGTLEKLNYNLAKLETKPKQNEADKRQIEELKGQISARGVLELRIRLAETVEALDKAGINSEYIQKKILPIAINPIKEILKNPKDIIDIAGAAVDVVLQDDAKKNQDSLRLIASKVDVGTLIGSSGLKGFLEQESNNLAKIATIIMQTNSVAKEQADKYGITPELAQKVIPAITKVASVALSDSNKLTEVYNELIASGAKLPAITAEQEKQEKINKKGLDKEKVAALEAKDEELKKQKNAVFSEMIGSVTKLALNDELLNSAKENVTQLLDNNQKAITGVITHNLSELQKETARRIEARAVKGADLTKLEEPSLVGQVLTGVSPAFAQNTAKAITGLASAVLKETSNEQIRNLAASGQAFLTASKEEKPQVIAKIAEQGVAIISNPNIVKSVAEVGRLLTTEKDQIQKVVDNALKTEPVKKQLEEFGVAPQIVQSLVPLATQVGAALLTEDNLKKIPEVYGAFAKFTESTSQEKAEKEAQKGVDRSKLSKDEVKALDEKNQKLKNQSNAALSGLIGAATGIALQDNVLNSVRSNVPALLDNNQAAISAAVTHNLGKDGQVLAGVNTEFVSNTVNTVSGLASAVLKETSNEQIRGLAAKGQEFLTASKDQKPKVIAEIAEQGMEIIRNPNIIESVAKVGELLATEKEQVQKVVDNVLKTEPVKKQLEEFGVAPQIVQSLVPLATQVGAALLTEDNLKKIPKIYNAFNEFTTSEKEQKDTALSKLIGTATDIVLQDEVLSSLRNNIPALLQVNNQAAISAAVTHNLGKDGQVLAGVSPAFAQNTTKAVTKLVSTILKETSNDQIRDLAASGQAFLSASKDQKPKVIAEIAEQGMEIIRNPNIIESVTKVGGMLTTEKDQIQKVVDNALKTEPVKKQLEKFGVAPQMVQSLVPMATQVGAVLLTEDNLKKIPEVYNAFNEFTTSEKEQKNAALSGLIGAATGIALQDNVLNSVRSNVPALLDNNQAAITGTILHNLGKLHEESLPRKVLAGVSPAFAENTTKAVTGLVSTVLKETSNDQIRDLAASGQKFLTASKEEKPQVIQGLIGQGAAILANPEIAKSLAAVGTTLVGSNADISKMINNTIATTELNEFGITKEQVQGVVPIVTNVAAAVLNSTQDIANIVTKSQGLLASLDKTTQGLTPKQAGSVVMILDSLNKIAGQPGISNTLQKDLPVFLTQNKDAIPVIASNIVKNTPELKKLASDIGVTEELIKDTAKLGTDLLISAAPMVDKLAKIKLNEKDKDKYPPTKDQLVTIISDVRDLANMSTDDLKKPKGKEVLNKVISGVITFKNSHDDLGKIIDEDLPKLLLLKENQEQLAKVIDGVIATKAGPGLKLKTEKIIGIAAKNLPTVTELADLYSQGRYAAMFPKIVKLAFQKEVLSTAISTYFTVRKYKAEGKKDVKVENVLPEAAKNVQPELPANDKKTELQGQVANIVQAQGVKKHFVLKSEGSEGSKSGEKTKESIKKEMGEYVSPPNKSTPTPVISPKKHEQLKLQGPGKN